MATQSTTTGAASPVSGSSPSRSGRLARTAAQRPRTTTTSAQASGTYKLVLADLTLTASGGDGGPFRYVYIYDDTPAGPVDPLVCYYDYGSAITLATGETLLIDFSAANGLFQVA